MACHVFRRRDPLLRALVLLFVALAAAPLPADPEPHVGSYHFLLEIAGVRIGGFASVDGLSIEQEVIEFREGSETGVIRKVPGPVRYGDITLKRGLVADDALSEWVWSSFDPTGAVDRRDGVIILVDRQGREVARWRFTKGWPSRWEGPTLKESGNDIAIEAITLTVESIDQD